MIPPKKRSKMLLAVEGVEDKYGSVTKAPSSAIRNLHAYINQHTDMQFHHHAKHHHYLGRPKKTHDYIWNNHGVLYSDSYRLCHAIQVINKTGMSQKKATKVFHFSMGFIAMYNLYRHYIAYTENGRTVRARNEELLLDKLPAYHFTDPPMNTAQITQRKCAGKIISKTYYKTVHYVRRRSK